MKCLIKVSYYADVTFWRLPPKSALTSFSSSSSVEKFLREKAMDLYKARRSVNQKIPGMTETLSTAVKWLDVKFVMWRLGIFHPFFFPNRLAPRWYFLIFIPSSSTETAESEKDARKWQQHCGCGRSGPGLFTKSPRCCSLSCPHELLRGAVGLIERRSNFRLLTVSPHQMGARRPFCLSATVTEVAKIAGRESVPARTLNFWKAHPSKIKKWDMRGVKRQPNIYPRRRRWQRLWSCGTFFEAAFGANAIPPCADLKARYAKHCSPTDAMRTMIPVAKPSNLPASAGDSSTPLT